MTAFVDISLMFSRYERAEDEGPSFLTWVVISS